MIGQWQWKIARRPNKGSCGEADGKRLTVGSERGSRTELGQAKQAWRAREEEERC